MIWNVSIPLNFELAQSPFRLRQPWRSITRWNWFRSEQLQSGTNLSSSVSVSKKQQCTRKPLGQSPVSSQQLPIALNNLADSCQQQEPGEQALSTGRCQVSRVVWSRHAEGATGLKSRLMFLSKGSPGEGEGRCYDVNTSPGVMCQNFISVQEVTGSLRQTDVFFRGLD